VASVSKVHLPVSKEVPSNSSDQSSFCPSGTARVAAAPTAGAGVGADTGTASTTGCAASVAGACSGVCSGVSGVWLELSAALLVAPPAGSRLTTGAAAGALLLLPPPLLPACPGPTIIATAVAAETTSTTKATARATLVFFVIGGTAAAAALPLPPAGASTSFHDLPGRFTETVACAVGPRGLGTYTVAMPASVCLKTQRESRDQGGLWDCTAGSRPQICVSSRSKFY
jgi:hypothetical protein